VLQQREEMMRRPHGFDSLCRRRAASDTVQHPVVGASLRRKMRWRWAEWATWARLLTGLVRNFGEGIVQVGEDCWARRKLSLGRNEGNNRKIGSQIFVLLNLNWFKGFWNRILNILKNRNLNFGSSIQIKEILRFKDLNSTQDFEFKKDLDLFKNQNLTKEDFKILSKIRNQLGLPNEICMQCYLANSFEKNSSANYCEIHYFANF
jgi:hypothetical protein